MSKLIDIDKLCNDLAKRWSIADKKKEDLIRAVMADVVTPIVVSQSTVDAVQVRHGRWETDEILCKIKDRINQEIEELKENGEKHADDVC